MGTKNVDITDNVDDRMVRIVWSDIMAAIRVARYEKSSNSIIVPRLRLAQTGRSL